MLRRAFTVRVYNYILITKQFLLDIRYEYWILIASKKSTLVDNIKLSELKRKTSLNLNYAKKHKQSAMFLSNKKG